MREIKFRAWDDIKEEMKDGNCLYWNGQEFVVGIWNFEETHIVDGETKAILMQYTGLKDKNGVEIYEGDIVEHNGYVGSVYYNSDEVSFFLKNTVENEDEAYLSNESRVIGNIYENPELLESK